MINLAGVSFEYADDFESVYRYSIDLLRGKGDTTAPADADPENAWNIETFYTGGGIWLTAACVEDSPLYYILDSDWDDGLTLYDRTDEDDDIDYPCQVMVWSKETAELTREEKTLLRKMRKDMENTAW